MKIKICGLKNSEELKRIDDACSPDFLGLIFYPDSPRNFTPSDHYTHTLAERVGVFVNASEEEIVQRIKDEHLTYVQLHGNESPELCMSLEGIVNVIKVFSIDDDFDFNQVNKYHNACDYFLFDTASPKHGGTGKQFSWQKLNEYTGTKPFFLSGGIGPKDVEQILGLRHPGLCGVDLNSRFEDTPGIKNITQLKYFIDHVRNNQKIHAA